MSRIIIAKFLGPEGYGLISLGYSVMLIASTISLMGLSSGVQRYIAHYRGKNNYSGLKGTLLTSLRISVPISIISMGIIIVNAEWISINIFHDQNLKNILLIFAIGIPFWTLSSLFNSMYIGFQQVKYQVYATYLFKDSAKLVLIVAFLLLGGGVLGASIGWILGIIGMAIVSTYYLMYKVLSPQILSTKSISVDKELFLFSLPLTFAGLAALVAGWTDTFMLGYFGTTTDVGIYNAALPTSQLLRMVLSPISQILFPVMATLHAERKMHQFENIYYIITKWIFYLVLPGLLLMILLSKQIMLVLFGTEYISGSSALSILSVGVFVSSILGPAQQIIIISGKTKIIMLCSSFAAILNVILNYFLIPLYGINGAALATSVSIGSISILYLIFAYRIEKIQPFRISFMKTLLSAFIAYMVAFEITRAINEGPFIILILTTAIYGIIYIAVFLLLKGFEQEEVSLLTDLNQQIGRKANRILNFISKFKKSNTSK